MSGAAEKPRMSSQMEAVVRLMTGKEERTIADKLADPNRPTWEQYKKDNEDKLNLSGADQKQMEQYRKELDEERDRRLARGTNHEKKSKKKKSKRKYDYSSDSDDSSEDDRKRKKHKKSKKRKKKHKRKYDSSDSDSDSSDDRRHKKKKRKKSKKKEGEGGEDNRYRLSNFFTGEGSE